ncbi:sinapoylglucose--choline O-sinapoyltransferase [Ranunculus cassubicifolius]
MDTSFVCIGFLFILSFLFVNGVSQSTVRFLPGLDGPLPFELETGYVSIDDSRGVELFYYFFKSENNPSKDPLLIWFTGGPGCSGLSAILFESGPFKLKNEEYNGSLPNLELNKYSWTKVSNIVYIDAPVGTGFSYATEGSHPNDNTAGKDDYTFIRKWLTQHPQYITNSLYIGGDSYSGKIVPITALAISDGIEVGDKPLINFKGYLLGNPITDRTIEINHLIQYAYGMGLLSYELFQSIKRNCEEEYVNFDPTNMKCISDIQDVDKCINGIFDQHILEPKCVQKVQLTSDERSREENSRNSLFFPTPKTPECKTYGYMLSYYWANNIEVQDALNIRKDIAKEWLRCNQCGINFTDTTERLTIGYHLTISKKNYRSLIYSGDQDMAVPYSSTQAWIRSLKYPVEDKWRPWTVEGQVAGYTTKYSNNMTFATVKGAGHIAIESKKKESLAMFKRWLSYEPL